MAKRILLVDDDVDYLATLQVQLEASGYEVTSADSVDKGLEALEQCQPDIAVVDLMMQEQDDGFRLCYHIKKKTPTVPVIMVTAVMSETGFDFGAATEEERRWIKADGFLAKPVRLEQLIREVERLVEG